jgi:Ca2+-binding EF-hand superfamily protein
VNYFAISTIKIKKKLRINDFKTSFEEANFVMSYDNLEHIMSILDNDGKNLIEYQEFLRALCDKKNYLEMKILKLFFMLSIKIKKDILI